jgi:ABC-type Fe3+/spermidine/putrescine transport system ATPase subunit
MPVEMIVRAQRFDAFPMDEFEPVEGMNHFEGRIKDRSYMGGEVSYFIELAQRPRNSHHQYDAHTALQIGESVSVQVSPHHCHLIPAE